MKAKFITKQEAAEIYAACERMRIKMVQLKMTIRELSAPFEAMQLAGYQRIGRILRGETVPTKKERAVFAKTLKCSQKELFGEEDSE